MIWEKLRLRIRRSKKLKIWALRGFGCLPLRRKIVFSSYVGNFFCDSPRAIFEALRRLAPNCRFVWLSKEENANAKLTGAKVVDTATLRACYHLATAKVWVDNTRKPSWTRKREGQFYVQTWHSGLTNKSGEGDEEEKLSRNYVRDAKQDSRMADLFISGSAWQTAHYRRAFWYDGEIMESGQPRSDLFFGPADEIQARVRAFFGIEEGVKLAIYAPTFRNSEALDMYDLDGEGLLRALRARYGGDWKLLVRLHPNVAGKHGAYAYGEDVLDASTYPDINELIVASEWLVTDYSSCAFDAMEAGKRVALYAPDLEEYEKERGFYWKFEELPFPLTRTNGELMGAIEGFDEEKYRRDAQAFMRRCGMFDDGRAAERVAKRILEELDR